MELTSTSQMTSNSKKLKQEPLEIFSLFLIIPTQTLGICLTNQYCLWQEKYLQPPPPQGLGPSHCLCSPKSLRGNCIIPPPQFPTSEECITSAAFSAEAYSSQLFPKPFIQKARVSSQPLLTALSFTGFTNNDCPSLSARNILAVKKAVCNITSVLSKRPCRGKKSGIAEYEGKAGKDRYQPTFPNNIQHVHIAKTSKPL